MVDAVELMVLMWNKTMFGTCVCIAHGIAVYLDYRILLVNNIIFM